MGSAPGKFVGLDLSDNLYLGGVKSFKKLPESLHYHSGFIGNIFFLFHKSTHEFPKVKKTSFKLLEKGKQIIVIIFFTPCAQP